MIMRRPSSGVDLSSVRQFSFSTSSPEPLELGMNEVRKVP